MELSNKAYKLSKKFSEEIHEPSLLSTDAKKPAFSFQHIAKGYCISDCQKEDKIQLADQLRVLGNLTW